MKKDDKITQLFSKLGPIKIDKLLLQGKLKVDNTKSKLLDFTDKIPLIGF